MPMKGMATMLLAGLDIGTTGCKITLYHSKGECLGRIYRNYPIARTAEEHEVDSVLIWQAVRELLTEAATRYPEISGIGVTSFGETFVLLDENDCPIRYSMLYTDPRGAAECAVLCETIGHERLAEITGVNPHPMYSIAKLMWIKSNRPEMYAATRRVCLMADFIVYQLTGTAQIDYSFSARTMAFDIRRLNWSDEIFDAAGIDKAMFSTPVPTGVSAGTLKPNLAVELGLNPETIIISAGHDQVAAAVGSGVFDAGVAVDGAGTVECITPVFEGIPVGNGMLDGNYAIVPYIESGKYVCYAFSYTGGALVQWFVENLAGYAATDAAQAGTSIYEQLKAREPLSNPTGLLVLPHFAGAATPYMDYGSKGAIVGLTISTTQQDIFCGIMEGVCYEMLLNMRRLEQAGVPFGSLRATGGGAKNSVWMQMKADVLGVPVTALRSSEAGGCGAAMMAGVAVGLFSDIKEAAKSMIAERETYQPRTEMHQKYLAVYERYEKLYCAVRPLV